MFSDCLELRDNLLTFGATDLHKYFKNFINFIEIDIAVQSFFSQVSGEMQKVPEFKFMSRTSHMSHWLVHYIIPTRIHHDL